MSMADVDGRWSMSMARAPMADVDDACADSPVERPSGRCRFAGRVAAG